MQQHLRSVVSDLRKLSSKAAADWLLEHYPAGSPGSGEAFTIISHLSWRPADQLRLAEHYLSVLPFASSRPYEVFASFMRVRRLVEILVRHMPADDGKKDLLKYHAGPVLRRAVKTPEDQEAVQRFLSE